MPKKLTIEIVRSEFENKGYNFLTTEYKNCSQKLEYICPNGHKHSIAWKHFKDGHGCPYCANRPPITIEFIRSKFAKENYKLLTVEYINCKQKLDYICPNGHKHGITWNNWKTGYRCPYCGGTMKKNVGAIEKNINKQGYKLLTNNYQNCQQKLHLVCPNGHAYYVSWDNWSGKKSRCPKCNFIGISKQELELFEFIKSIYDGVIFRHNRALISPYELDIVIPDKKIAIEYCGLYWHSELAGKNKNYHLNKLNLCNKKDYRLITIFEDELLYNKEIIFSRLKDIFRSNDLDIIYARNCSIKSVSIKEVRKFCEENHLQGYHGASVKLGAFYKNELVSIMTFSRPSIAKGSRNNENNTWELSRFCSRAGCRIIGVASKLLKYFEKNYTWDEIFSYADRRWSNGDLYEKIGFDFIKKTQPNYWYISKQKRIHRFALRKQQSDPKDQTEWEIRKSQGHNRIWDCGNLKYQRNNTSI